MLIQVWRGRQYDLLAGAISPHQAYGSRVVFLGQGKPGKIQVGRDLPFSAWAANLHSAVKNLSIPGWIYFPVIEIPQGFRG